MLYTGSGGAQSITGVGFQPDLVWVKSRSNDYQPGWVDAVRGVENYISSSETDAEATTSGAVDAFDSDGFGFGGSGTVWNGSGATFASWNWLAGTAPTADNSAGAGATPTAGSVKINGSNLGSALAGTTAATRLSANTTNGFSIVSYTGTFAAATVGHGLSQKPELIIAKNLSASHSWTVGADVIDVAWEEKLLLDTTAAKSATNDWNDTVPTATVFSVGVDSPRSNGDGNDMIAYCFHSVEGYSKVGSYTGNGNVNGTFVYTGFRPAYVMYEGDERS